MIPRIGKTNPTAFTLIELLTVLVLIVILVLFFSQSPGIRAKENAKLAACMSNQKQIVLGLTMFASAHGDKLPSMISITNGGALEPMTDGDVTSCYAALTNSIDPSTFICRSDNLRLRAERGHSLTHSNFSYFISLDTTLKDSPVTTILTGDRHLESNGKPVAPGVFTLSTNSNPTWTTELHFIKGQGTRGAVSFADGHVEASKNLAGIVARQSVVTNRVVVP